MEAHGVGEADTEEGVVAGGELLEDVGEVGRLLRGEGVEGCGVVEG
jgi:hypothetical protein